MTTAEAILFFTVIYTLGQTIYLIIIWIGTRAQILSQVNVDDNMKASAEMHRKATERYVLENAIMRARAKKEFGELPEAM